MKIVKKFAITCLALGFLASCGTNNDDIKPSVIAPTSIMIDPNSIVLEIDQEYRELSVKFVPTTADTSLTWTSLNPEIVEVNQLGDIKALAAGETTVVATSKVDENIKAELSVKVNRGPLTVAEKINNSLGNIKFEGEAYKELYSEGKEEPGTIMKDTMMSQFTENTYHFELGDGFDTMDYGGKQTTLWCEEGTVVQYLRNAKTNTIERVETKYDDGSAPSWDNFKNPMYILKDFKAPQVADELKLDVTLLETQLMARDLVERVAFFPFESDVIQDVTLSFNETRLTNITFRTTKHSDKFQDCVYGASLNVVGYGEEVTDYPKPEPIKATDAQLKLEKAFKELDENNFVMSYQDYLMTGAAGTLYKTNSVVFFKESSSDKYSRGIAEINGEVFEIGYSSDNKALARLSTPLTNKDGTKATFKDNSPSYTSVSSVFFNTKEEKPNAFYLEDAELCQYFGNCISNCAGPFDLGIIMSNSTEVCLTDEGKVQSITALYYEEKSATLTPTQIGGDVTLPINIDELPVVESF